MSTKISNHVDKRGALPTIKIVNWGKYITISFKVGDHETTSFIYPAEGESTEEFVVRVRAQFIDIDVEVEDSEKYLIKN